MSLTDKIRELVNLDGSHHEKGNKEAAVVAICSQKGGVGKTTTAVNLGAALSLIHQKNVLIVDLDPQGHVEKSLGGIVHRDEEYKPLSKVLTDKRGDLLEGVIKTKIQELAVTPGDHELVVAENAIASRIGRELLLRNAMTVARTHFDYILLDCPPSVGNLTVNALSASDYAMVPCEMSALAFEGVTDLLSTFEEIRGQLNRRLKLLGVLFTRVDGRNVTMNDLVRENMKKLVDGKLLKTMITVNTDLNKAQLDGTPIFQYAPSSSGSENYRALTIEFLNRLKGRGVKKSPSRDRPLAQNE